MVGGGGAEVVVFASAVSGGSVVGGGGTGFITVGAIAASSRLCRSSGIGVPSKKRENGFSFPMATQQR